MKKIILTVLRTIGLSVLFMFTVHAQQSQPITQHLFNRFLLNPAACGADGYTTIGTAVKNQWAGFTGSPSNQTLYGQLRVSRNGIFGNYNHSGRAGYLPENVGLGLALFNDLRGPIRTTGTQFTYAYHLENRTGQLSLGLTASLFQYYIDRNKLTTAEYDQYLNSLKLSKIIPDALFGVHYTTPDYYAGFSVSNMFQSFLAFGGRNGSKYKIERQYLLMGGYIIEADQAWSLVPSMQCRFTERGSVQADINLMAYYFDRFWFGLSGRTGNELTDGGASLMFGMHYKDYYFGYAYDNTLSSIRNYSYGSHELMVSFTFGKYERFYRYSRRYEFQNFRQPGRRTHKNYKE